MAELTPQTREEHFLARIAGDPTALVLEPQTRVEHFLQRIIDNGGPSPGPGDAVSSVNGKTGAVVLVPSDIGAEPQRLTVTVTENAGTYTGSKTFAEMWTAYHTNHKTVTVEMGDGEFALAEADPSGMAFVSTTIDGSTATVRRLAVNDSDVWAYAEFAAEQKPTTVTVTGTTPTITPAANAEYNCESAGALTSLTISNPPATGDYTIKFVSGSTPTVINWSTIRWPGDVAPTIEANTEYEINVSDNRGVYNEGWPLPAGE